MFAAALCQWGGDNLFARMPPDASQPARFKAEMAAP